MEVIKNITPVASLKRLLELKPAFKTFGEILNEIILTPEDFKTFLKWNDDHYTRIRLFRDQDFEVILATFLPGQSTPIHNYGNQQGWGLILEGTLTEAKFGSNKTLNSISPIYEKEVHMNQVTYINDYLGMHQFLNKSNDRVISLHLYVEPFDTWTQYNAKSETFEEKKIGFDYDFSDQFI